MGRGSTVASPARQREIEQHLGALTMFRGLRRGELQRVARMLDMSRLPAGWRLMRQGQGAFEAFVILDGTAVVTVDGVEVATLGPGDTVGEMALLDGRPRSATVTAQTNLSVLVITPDTLDELLALPSVALAVIATMAARLRAIEGTPQHA